MSVVVPWRCVSFLPKGKMKHVWFIGDIKLSEMIGGLYII